MANKNVIFYFSGTGNSLSVAQKITNDLGDCDIYSIPSYQKRIIPAGYERIGFVYPVYFRGAPLIVKEFVESLDLSATLNAYLFAIATCGGRPGNGLTEVNALLSARRHRLDFGQLLVMGGNYILMYGKREKGDGENARVAEELPGIAAAIRDKENRHCGKQNPFLTLPANYFRRSVHKTAQNYTVNSDCTSCGQCARMCPVGNIKMVEGKPTFRHHCEQCMACIQWCPQQALNHKDETQNRERYRHPDITATDLIRSAGSHAT